jgi:inosine-uridine nucleoside N-ribohydrolase
LHYEISSMKRLLIQNSAQSRESVPQKKPIVHTVNMPVVILTDPGIDDFAALGLALAPGVFDIKAIVACAGNVEIEKTLQNTLDICALANRNIPVLKGAGKPFTTDWSFPTDKAVHGDNGLGGIHLERSHYEMLQVDTIEYIMQLLVQHDAMTLISLAGLTDLYYVLRAASHRGLINKISGITMMGGAFNSKEANAPKSSVLTSLASTSASQKYAEFNFYNDPDATKKVFELCNGIIPIALFPLDFTHHNCRWTEQQNTILESEEGNSFCSKLAKALKQVPIAYQKRFSDNSLPLHDIFPVMSLLYAHHNDILIGEWVHVNCHDSQSNTPGKVEISNNPEDPTVFRVAGLSPQCQQDHFRLFMRILRLYGEQTLRCPAQASMFYKNQPEIAIVTSPAPNTHSVDFSKCDASLNGFFDPKTH